MLRWAFLLLVPVFAQATIDAYPFPNEMLERRYDALIAELRCPQCLNTNLAGSDAMIARDLRREVHRLLLEGRTDQEVRTFMHERYGDFILYRPGMNGGTLVLWFGPFVLGFIAALIWWRVARSPEAEVEISGDEKARLDDLLKKDRS